MGKNEFGDKYMNLIDRDKLLYELSCAVLSECSQDEYEHINDIINEQPIVKLNNIYNEHTNKGEWNEYSTFYWCDGVW